MKAYLIDPFAETVTQVEVAEGIDAIYAQIQADTFDVVTINHYGDTLYVDDDGLFKAEQRFFHFAGYHQPLAGRALLLGTGAAGNSQDPKLSLDEVRNRVDFVGADRRPAG